MKIAYPSIIFSLLLLLPGCSEDSDNNFIPGYIDPGSDSHYTDLFGDVKYKTRVLSPSKSYSLINGTETCSGDDCLVIYTPRLYIGELLYEGIAAKSNVPGNDFIMTMYRLPGITSWRITIIKNGYRYIASVENPFSTYKNDYDCPPPWDLDPNTAFCSYTDEEGVITKYNIYEFQFNNINFGGIAITSSDNIRAFSYGAYINSNE